MIDSWSAAHELEVYVYGGLVVLCNLIVFGESLGAAWREWKKKRKDGLL